MIDDGSRTLASLEAALAAAARRFVRDGRRAASEATQRRGLEAICRRVGFSSAVATAIGEGSADAATRDCVLERLEAEKVALRRLGRRADPAYDINRHIAIHRALKTIGASEAADTNARPPSGAELNARFRQRKGAARRPAPRPSVFTPKSSAEAVASGSASYSAASAKLSAGMPFSTLSSVIG